jgi:hypothetical protein
VAQDPRFARLCGLARIPTDRTVVNWLKQFTQASLRALVRINSELRFDQIRQLQLRRLTIDIDGPVIRTGGQVAWALHGCNPPPPKDPGYSPLRAHLAPTGQLLRVQNRPGKVPDFQGAAPLLRELMDELRARLGRALVLEFRMMRRFSRTSCSSCEPAGAAATPSRRRSANGPGCGLRPPHSSSGRRRSPISTAAPPD